MNVKAVKPIIEPIVQKSNVVLESSILPKLEKAAKSQLHEFIPQTHPVELEKIENTYKAGEFLNIFG